MINKKIAILTTKILIILILIAPSNASMESHIVLKINNEIITNLDIEEEYRYLTTLNNDLKKLDKLSIMKISKNSVIREKIKKNEILKYYTLDHTREYVNDVLQKLYLKLNIKNIDEFKNYLASNNLTLEDVKKKLEIELLWNDLIKNKFTQQININEKILKQKIKNDGLNKKLITKYDLSEILFQVSDQKKLINIIDDINKSVISSGFNNTANIYSVSDTAKFGGHIGWVDENQLSKNVIKLIKQLNIGEITEPIKVPTGFLILRINNKKEKKNNIDKNKILKELINYEKQKQYNQFSLIYYNKIKLNNKISE